MTELFVLGVVVAFFVAGFFAVHMYNNKTYETDDMTDGGDSDES